MPSFLKPYLAEVVKVASVVLVVLGALPAIAQAAGIAHIVVPAALLGYATIASSVVAGFLAWAKAHGVTPASVASRIAHRVR
jgi:hypothetical protein